MGMAEQLELAREEKWLRHGGVARQVRLAVTHRSPPAIERSQIFDLIGSRLSHMLRIRNEREQ
jgi:hypothetical protein